MIEDIYPASELSSQISNLLKYNKFRELKSSIDGKTICDKFKIEEEEIIPGYSFTEELKEYKLSPGERFKSMVVFDNKIQVEDFLSMYIQSVISDKTGKEYGFCSGRKEEIQKRCEESGTSDITDSLTKNFLLSLVQNIINKDIRNFCE